MFCLRVNIGPRTVQVITLIGLSICLLSCTPLHVVKPLPNFVEAALESGDKIIVTTTDGNTRKLVVTEIRDGLIVGKNQQVAIDNIVELKKQAWSRPESPCGGAKPLGCSLPLVISISSDEYDHYREEFHDACTQHDYCYRHGVKTYSVSREACDNEFLTNMQASCAPVGKNIATKTIQLMDGLISSRRTCMAIAKSFYLGVRKFGIDKFETTNSTFCEYNGPPPQETN